MLRPGPVLLRPGRHDQRRRSSPDCSPISKTPPASFPDVQARTHGSDFADGASLLQQAASSSSAAAAAGGEPQPKCRKGHHLRHQRRQGSLELRPSSLAATVGVICLLLVLVAVASRLLKGVAWWG